VRAGAEGAPVAFRRADRWLEVIELLDRYRTDDRWWTPAPVSRTYYEIELDDGRVATLFRDETDGSWWQQRYG
jgi:hypothetical protein